MLVIAPYTPAPRDAKRRDAAASATTSWEYQAVSKVLEAFMTQDCDAVLALCADHVTFEFPFIGDGELDAGSFQRKVGRTIGLMEDLRFYDLQVNLLAGDAAVLARYRGTARVSSTGREYTQKYLSVFEFEDGRLTHFEENYDTSAFKTAFGLDPGWRMK